MHRAWQQEARVRRARQQEPRVPQVPLMLMLWLWLWLWLWLRHWKGPQRPPGTRAGTCLGTAACTLVAVEQGCKVVSGVGRGHRGQQGTFRGRSWYRMGGCDRSRVAVEVTAVTQTHKTTLTHLVLRPTHEATLDPCRLPVIALGCRGQPVQGQLRQGRALIHRGHASERISMNDSG